jgi:hypothetical protein
MFEADAGTTPELSYLVDDPAAWRATQSKRVFLVVQQILFHAKLTFTMRLASAQAHSRDEAGEAGCEERSDT